MSEPYVCRGCSRDVDADLEPSPGEPSYCSDCHWHAIKEDAL